MYGFEWAGTNHIGNTKLLHSRQKRIGVFASRSNDPAIDISREQWAIQIGREHKCIIGTFHSKAEKEILYFVLKYGGSAVWLMGCSIPDKLPDFCKSAIDRNKLLIISCFQQEHRSFATARFCAHLARTFSKQSVIWSMKEGGLTHSIYKISKARRYKVQIMNGDLDVGNRRQENRGPQKATPAIP